MFTKNYYVMKSINQRCLNTSVSETYIQWIESIGNLTYLNGTDALTSADYLPASKYDANLGAKSPIYCIRNNTNMFYDADLIVGSSDEKEDLYDYMLKSEIMDLTAIDTTKTFIGYVNEDKSQILITKSFINNTDNQITIKEVGYTKKIMFGKDGTTFTSQGPFLIARNVLSNPITVQPGETVTVSMTLDL